MRARITFFVVTSASVLLLGAANSGQEYRPRPRILPVTRPLVPRMFRLTRAECDDGRKAWAEAAVAQMEERLRVSRENLRYPERCTARGGGSGGGCLGFSSGGASYTPDYTSTEGEGASEYSTTNLQEKGVDEADFVKNDGERIYILANGRFTIVDAWPPEQAHVLGSVEVDGWPQEMYVANDRAIVFVAPNVSPEGPMAGFCEYGYDCSMMGSNLPLRVEVLDISDHANPRLVRTLDFKGGYVESRRIGTSVFVVVSTSLSSQTYGPVDPDGLPATPAELQKYQYRCGDNAVPYGDDAIDAMFESLREENAARIRDSYESWQVPSFTDTAWDHGASSVPAARSLLDCKGLYVPYGTGGADFVSVVAFDLGQFDEPSVSTVLSGPGWVYASQESLYIATSRASMQLAAWYSELPDELSASTVHRFLLEGGTKSVSYAGSGVVKGRVLNQFSLDEHDGALRVATTTGYLPEPEVHSTVTVLLPAGDGDLDKAGAIDHIAPGEDIRSVGLVGDKGFVVTFKKTDPLFTLDLSDPHAPRLVGELKIPGFSTYLQMLDPGHLLSIGYDAQDEGSFAWFQGIMLQVFDVSDLAKPSLLHKTVIGTRGTTSDAATNHLAFTYFKPKDMLAVPMVICEGGSGGSDYGDTVAFDGLLVYKVTVANGFESVGRLPRAGPASPGCQNWWTQSVSTVERSIFMDDYVWAVQSATLRAGRLDMLDEPVVTVNLP
jgi:hypothetical protein